jgi:glycosyltransferase involved in cell wall biosynthesis
VLHVLGYKANLHALLAGIWPRVTTVHGWLFRADWKERLYGWIELFCLRRCDRVIALSRYYENYLAVRGVRRERLVRIPSGLPEVPASFPAAGAGDGVCFGMMGRFSEEKNHAMFLRAAARVVKDYPAARFKVAGSGPLEGEVRAMAGDLGLGGAVDFCGYQEVDDYFATIDVYVICSSIENLPYSMLEGMARSRPVIGTSVGGISDLIQDGDTGYLVASDDDGALAEAMAKFLVEPGRVGEMGAAGKRKLMNDFGFDRCIGAHRVLYRGLESR